MSRGTSTPIAAELAEFALSARPSEVPGLHAVGARHLLDLIGCGLAAVGSGDGGDATRVALAQEGSAQSSVLGT